MSNAYEAGQIVVHGDVDAGYGPVYDQFVVNFRDRHDLGAGCTAYIGGRKVVDLGLAWQTAAPAGPSSMTL